MTAAYELVGKKFGMWQVVGRGSNTSDGRTQWLCVCRCGNNREVVGVSLVKGISKSCGCVGLEKNKRRKGKLNPSFKHGMTNTRTFKIWSSMLTRCACRTNSNFPSYGGRGITVCPSWKKSFLNFLKDMGEAPKDRTLGRIDNDKGYCTTNCRWETIKEQQNNRSINKYLEYQGLRLTIAQWADRTGLTYHALWQRVQAGWETEKALTTPVRPSGRWK